ncbi:MAG: type I-E CRISPR-associated protein Cas7/Cse4/CasC [Deltaproteobacteria bacterium]|nr:type I-E CRISPR-associated protein Cas7/Cse4/CasC [Deltaproteobacteria bacterium]
MTTFIEFHALRSFPPSNLNRDDLGSPKTAVFGGSRRLRISSQCLKRTWRTSEHFRGEFAADQLGIRTARLPEQVLAQVGDELDDATKAGLLALLSAIGRKKAVGGGDGEEGEDGEEDDAGEADLSRTAHLLYLSVQEINVVAMFAKENHERLSKVLKKKKPDGEAIKKLRKDLETYLQEHTSKNAVDVGLFGRFVTSDEFDTVEGALQVAHALGTQKVELEYDYFTAVDDLGEDPGAGHLGESEFASSVLYLYACCDLGQLNANLGGRSKDGRVADDEARALAKKTLPALARAMAEATPKGKKTGTAPHTPAEYVEVVVRRGAPLSFANAFTKPVAAVEGDGDVMAASIRRLALHRDRIETAYGRDADTVARFVLCLRDVDGASAAENSVTSIAELGRKLASTLGSLPQA